MKKFIIISYSVFLSLFTVFSYAFIDPNLSYLKDVYTDFSFSNRLLVTIYYAISIIIFFVFYGLFVWFAVKKKLRPEELITLMAITVGVLLFSYPAMLSYDIFNYLTTAKVLFFYSENPYIIMPVEFLGEPFLSYTHAANKVALYGPFWLVLTGIPYLLGFGNFLITLFSFKLFSAIFYLMTSLFIWKISKNIVSVALFSLNPLVIIETLISGHNDIVMITFVLFSFFLIQKKNIFFAILFFILSILIKYATILLIPIFLYTVYKTIKHKEINWKNIFYFSFLAMFVAFLLSPIREEIYPWYAIWFMSFVFLVLNKKILLYLSIAFSFSLLLRYTPYMFAGVYTTPVPIIKEVISFAFPVLVLICYVFKKKI